ncbi:methyltransferase domain-containing protein [Sulfitobacter sp. D35]|uniref:class I SAM-dependent DNA methyltransferase n=1 Tax=Sulfitobacter sp. D35 TaxID=3083252 RepID=UPI00296F57F4|nr:methyltransferase domain-containing protein [Sulfitobacter sp. D35]MDW4497752.1 methyltransferase domain-containing protein [Sulfitobacter sp. D35]
MSPGFLAKAYQARTQDETRDLYDAWSETYEDEVVEQGYATPARCASALGQFSDDLTLPVLDFGCGTGLSGEALAREGFRTIDGVDISEDMIAQARAKGVYRDLSVIEGDGGLAAKAANYSAVAAIGVIGAGAAPPTVFDEIMHGLPRGGLFVLSFNDHALADRSITGRMNEWLDCGAARCLFSEHGAHLPGIDLKSTVYVLRKS